jgi:ubiquinone/menaquinone biosynthesis C-methylase UbiE
MWVLCITGELEMVLTRAQAKKFYDRFGSKQDAQSFYEDKALDDLIAHAAFEHANAVVELGCGTGRFALRLLEKHLPPAATYFGTDLSETMIEIAEQRLLPYKERAKAVLSDGAMRFPLPDHSVDRVVSTYVLDLLPEADIREVIAEARRVLMPGGKLCLAGLTTGVTFTSRIVSTIWSAICSLHAPLVGGCRPVRLDPFFDENIWSIEYRNVVTQFGVPSGVLIASPKSGSDK